MAGENMEPWPRQMKTAPISKRYLNSAAVGALEASTLMSLADNTSSSASMLCIDGGGGLQCFQGESTQEVGNGSIPHISFYFTPVHFGREGFHKLLQRPRVTGRQEICRSQQVCLERVRSRRDEGFCPSLALLLTQINGIQWGQDDVRDETLTSRQQLGDVDRG